MESKQKHVTRIYIVTERTEYGKRSLYFRDIRNIERVMGKVDKVSEGYWYGKHKHTGNPIEVNLETFED